MEKINTIIVPAIFALTVIIVAIVAAPRIDRYLDIRAVEACSNSSSFVRQNSKEEFTAKYPIEDLYKNCISATK